MKKLSLLIVIAVFTVNMVKAQTKAEKKAAKAQAEQNEYQEMKALINSAIFMFEGEWATSQSGRRINLMSNPTFIKLNQKVAEGYLPFFGTAQIGGYGAGGAIEFKGNVENYSVTFDDKKQKAVIKFNSKGVDSSENFDVTLTVFGSLSTSVNINSSSRSTMGYNGNLKAIEKNQE